MELQRHSANGALRYTSHSTPSRSNSLQRAASDEGLNSSQNFASILGGKYLEKITETEDHLNNNAVTRAAATYYDKFDKDDIQEILTCASLDWLLSGDDTRIAVEPPPGLITNIDDVTDQQNILLIIPSPTDIDDLELRELHQIVRELVLGIYVLNETPCITLETNFDQSTSCQMPPGYHDTRVGQLLIAVDYTLKSLWHGAFFPKDKRGKFAERWRQAVNLNSMTGEPETKRDFNLIWTEAGLLDITKDPDYYDIYNTLPQDIDDTRNFKVTEEKKFFMKHVDELTMTLTFRQESIQQRRNMFVLDSVYKISSTMKGDKLDLNGLKKIQKRLTHHEAFLQSVLHLKKETSRQLVLLKVVSFLIPLLTGLRRKGKIPKLSTFLPTLTHDECKTDRELPPIVIFPDLKCKNFDMSKKYQNLHGGITFEKDTPVAASSVSEAILQQRDDIVRHVTSQLEKIQKSTGPMLESYPLVPLEIENQTYYAFIFDLETYYPLQPKEPKWVHAYCDEMARLKPKRLPMSEPQIHEQFRKRFGYQRTIKLKQVPAGLQASAKRGLAAVFHTICRRQPASRLHSQDQHGLSLLHYAAMYNRAQIIMQLVVMGCDVNVKKFNNASATGVMPIHLAARCGALEALACLVALNADTKGYDTAGFASIHYASYFNNVSCLRLLLNRQPGLLEIRTLNKSLSTGLLLAATSGALDAVVCLLEYGANVLAKDAEGNGLVQLAALGEHTNILQYFAERNLARVPVWSALVDMLSIDAYTVKEKSAKCLEVLTLPPKATWKQVLEANAIASLLSLLKTDSHVLQSLAASVLCNTGEKDDVRHAIAQTGAIPTLVELVRSENVTVHSRAAVVLADLACINNYQKSIAFEGGIASLVGLLLSDVEHVLVNAVNALRLLVEDNYDNQTDFSTCGAVPTLIHLLGHTSRRLQANVAACVAAVAKHHRDNQDTFVINGAVKLLVQLFRSKEQPCQLKAAKALEALAADNPTAQDEINSYDGAKPLIRLLKLWAMDMKEQGATSLWALAGSSLPQQKRIAEMIGINILVDMLMTKSEKLQFVAGMALIALGQNNMKNQNRISEGGGVMALVRLLRNNHPPSSRKVLIMAIQVLGYLCVGVAHQSNKAIQSEICATEALPILCSLLKTNTDEEVRVEVAMSLSKIVLSNGRTQERLLKEKDFSITLVLQLLQSENETIKLRAAMALSTFAYNNALQQQAIDEAGGVSMNHFSLFLDSNDEEHKAHAAFQIVVLARVISNSDQVVLSAFGVELLVRLLKSDHFSTKVLVASLVASLAHTRAGIPDAMVTAGAVENLVENLKSPDKQVRESAAVALGYLSFNRTAARILLVACRNQPTLFSILKNNLGSSKMSAEFAGEWKRNLAIGLPSQSLVINGGPPVPTKSETSVRRPRSVHQISKGGEALPGMNASLRETASLPAVLRRPRTTGPRPKIKGSGDGIVVSESTEALKQRRTIKAKPFL